MQRLQNLILLLLTTAFLGGCSLSSGTQIHWQDTQKLIAQNVKLEVGDILITPRDWKDPISWWGHSAVIVNDKKQVGEYPKLGYGYFQVPLKTWLLIRQKVGILRYKNITPSFRKKLQENNQKISQLSYGIFASKDELLSRRIEQQSDFYCSSYIWYLYAKTAQDLGYNLDIDGNQDDWVMPYDFLLSDKLIVIE